MAGGSRSRSTTKGLLICGFAAAAVYMSSGISFWGSFISHPTVQASRSMD